MPTSHKDLDGNYSWDSLARSAKSTPSPSTTFYQLYFNKLKGRYLISLYNLSSKACKKWCWAPTLCGRNGFRFYFTGITSLLFTFPSRYWFTIGEIEYLALADSTACFPQGYRFLRYLGTTTRKIIKFCLRDYYSLW